MGRHRSCSSRFKTRCGVSLHNIAVLLFASGSDSVVCRFRLGCCRGLIASPLHPWRPVAPGGGDGPVARRSGAWKNVAKCFENLPAFLRKDFRNLLPRFARGGTTIARHCDFLSPLDPFLGSLAYRRVSLVTACFLCGFMPLYPWHAGKGKVSCLVFR